MKFKYRNFLVWWLYVVLLSIGGVFLYYTNVFTKILEVDHTKISLIIAAIFLISTFYCGFLNLKLEHKQFSFIKQKVELGWYVCELLMKLGLLGTVIAFILILKGFVGLDVSNVSSVQTLMVDLSTGMGVGLYTTCVGLITNILLVVQLLMLEHALKVGDSSAKDCVL